MWGCRIEWCAKVLARGKARPNKRLPLTLGLIWLTAKSAYTLSPQAGGEREKSTEFYADIGR
jgi:hypothetical protein